MVVSNNNITSFGRSFQYRLNSFKGTESLTVLSLLEFNNGRCKSEEFECADGGCIDLAYKCDGENDCSDFSDEAACSKFYCA